jgi:hypothetical protein
MFVDNSNPIVRSNRSLNIPAVNIEAETDP